MRSRKWPVAAAAANFLPLIALFLLWWPGCGMMPPLVMGRWPGRGLESHRYLRIENP